MKKSTKQPVKNPELTRMVGGREQQIIDERKKKITSLRAEGIDPYSHRFIYLEPKEFSEDIKEAFSHLKPEEKTTTTKTIAGRIMIIREFGKLNFLSVQDLKGTIQVVIKKDESPETAVHYLKKIDSGDIIGVQGTVMKTKTGEVSILAEDIHLLTKSILPLPDKHAGLKDDEERLRKRYLDIIMNSETKMMFIKKQKFWSTIRNFLLDKGFLEVETPVLENSAGGAAATPFATHHNALNLDVYLRISMGELWQKKLLVAGYEKTFEIGRQFRNEGMDAEHLQDYTQMEFYWGYANYEDGMKLVEEMYKKAAMAVLGTLTFTYGEHHIDLGKEWKRYDYETIIEQETGINIYAADKQKIMKKLDALGMEYDTNVDKWRLVDLLWKYCRKKISGPGFLVGQPVELTPLAKRSKKDPRKVEQFQVLLAGSEMGNGYSELNDPLDQEERFIEQRKKKEAGDTESMDHDETFIEALKYGMPPACGFGVSERLFALFMSKPIRETVIFPLMKPDERKDNSEGKAKESKMAVVILNKEAKMEKWQEMNTIAHLNASFASRAGRQLLMQDSITTKDGERIILNIQHAIMIKEAHKNNELITLIKLARENNLELSEFTREMQETTDDRKVIEITKNKNKKDIEYLGLLIFGKKSLVEKLTKQFNLVK